MGKTFAEVVAKFVVPALLSRLTFEYVDQDIQKGLKEKQKLNLTQDEDPVVMMRVHRVKLTD